MAAILSALAIAVRGSETEGLRVEEVARGLEIPWALAFAPDDTLFVTERVGRIRIVRNGVLQAQPWATLPVANWQAAGLSGLAISPDYATSGHVFVMGTFRSGDRFVNRIYRFTNRADRGESASPITAVIPSIDTHAGGALAFGPDGLLYAAIGDGPDLSAVQVPYSTAGKILRIRPDGGVPPDNPTAGSLVYALGFRNPQGFAWNPRSGEFFATDHGPTDMPGEAGRTEEDELNLVVAGGNYGWPLVSGMHHDTRFRRPLLEWSPAMAPSGLAIAPWSTRDRVTLFVGALFGQQVRRVDLLRTSAGEWRVRSERSYFAREYGRIRAVTFDRNGNLYFSTSNVNTPGEPERKLARTDDDRVYRVRGLTE